MPYFIFSLYIYVCSIRYKFIYIRKYTEYRFNLDFTLYLPFTIFETSLM